MDRITEIGRVAEVWRYPVKSMRGEALDKAEVRWTGVDGDRQYAFVKTRDKSRFPWLTGRTVAEMVLFGARYANGAEPKTSAVAVTTATGTRHEITAPELIAELEDAAGTDVTLMQLGRGAYDSMPISVIGQGTLTALTQKAGREVVSSRFRPNIVIDQGREQDWLGRRLIFGDPKQGVRLFVAKPIERCSMITVDPVTAQRDARLLRTVVEEFNNQVGVYCTPEILGQITPGAPVFLA